MTGVQTCALPIFLADALRWAGAESVVESAQDWPRLSLEEVVRLQPDYLVLAGSHSDAAERKFQELSDQPGWRDLTAVRLRHVAVISDAVSRPAPRLLAAIEQLARQLHPEVFAAQPEAGDPKQETRPPEEFPLLARQERAPCSR